MACQKCGGKGFTYGPMLPNGRNSTILCSCKKDIANAKTLR